MLNIGTQGMSFCNDILKEKYLVFSGKKNENMTYKAVFNRGHDFRKILTEKCSSDEYLQIRFPTRLIDFWEFFPETTISDNVDKCIEEFQKAYSNSRMNILFSFSIIHHFSFKI